MMSEHAKRLASVTPSLASAFLEIAADFAAKYPGCRITPAQGYRTPAQQKAAAAAGRSAADGTIRFSKHQAYPALALDFAVLDESGRYITDGEDPRYGWVGERFEGAGFRWGGRWRKPDWDHVESPESEPVRPLDAYALYTTVTDRAPFLRLI